MLTKVCLVKAVIFPVVMYGCESWTIKKAKCRRIDAFKLWCWRLLRVPWTARRCNQSIPKEISPEYSLEGLMLKLKLQYFGYLMWKTDSLVKTMMLGKTEGGKRRGQQRMRWLDGFSLDGHEFEQFLGVDDGQGGLACCSPWGCKELDTTEQLNWTIEDRKNFVLVHCEVPVPSRYGNMWFYVYVNLLMFLAKTVTSWATICLHCHHEQGIQCKSPLTSSCSYNAAR